MVRFLFVEEGADTSSSSTPSASRASSPRLQSLSQPDYTGNLSSFLGGSDLLEEMSSAACTQGAARGGRDGEVFTLNPLLFRGHR